ncbi:hypothetical protein MNKW57_17500 [Biformimicrobium ophioploci]|uniref:Uncharacterized protein n=1 Tax=Biformimicrobium ophioploci TaxID=3036711 RepID=A0ABQ6LZ97_9GAMM|nr:hypothetical protein MNKW57_17500 [Microbulbifer sp. NKW57]
MSAFATPRGNAEVCVKWYERGAVIFFFNKSDSIISAWNRSPEVGQNSREVVPRLPGLGDLSGLPLESDKVIGLYADADPITNPIIAVAAECRLDAAAGG